MDAEMDDSMMGRGAMMEDEGTETTQDESNEKPRIFFTQEQLGGRKCKEGDILPCIVRDVDPETGGVEAELQDVGKTTETAGYASDFEKSVPEEA